ncbi:MAG TPA: hypothetical protein PLD36_14255, partial [Bacteroidia bacterium]|nr:hypothetical protein [Bacteroidia bacterium]
MKKILLLVMGVMMLAGSVSAQRKMAPSSSSAPSHRTCGTQQLPDDFEKWMDDQIKADRAAGNTGKAHVVYTLPVVIHVIHNGSAVGASYNLSDAQILSQIAVLNEDYRKLNADAALVPTVWQGVAVDCEINFCLAQKDPSGAATTGIDRINRNTKGWTAPPYSQTYVDATIKPNSIWN